MADKTKQAIKAYEKEDYEKVEDILFKSMEKDSLNPATEFVWALLYSTENYPGFYIDSAHYYIELACEHIQIPNEDHLDELEDADLYEYDLKNRKLAIDSMAFAVATSKNDIAGYEHFISLYSNAADYEQAITIRNQLVFAEVEKEHTWQAYQGFIENYPNATQIEKAKIQYDKLIFESRTSSGQLNDLEKFLVDEPNTPYRHSIEKKIFESYVGQLNKSRMIEFYNKYDNPILSNRTLNMLYYLDDVSFYSLADQIKVNSGFIDSVQELETINKVPLSISLRNDYFEFLDLTGANFLNGEFEWIKDQYRCGDIRDELITVKTDGVKKLINRNGDVIYEGYDGSVEDLGCGLLAVEEAGKIGIVHKSGFRLLPAEYENLKLIDNSLIVFENGGLFGVMSITGKEYIKPKYDNIYLKGAFWVFQNGDFLGISNKEEIYRARTHAFEVQLPYEEVELISDNYIIGFNTDTEVLLNEKLEVVSPPNTKRINTRHETWVMEMYEGYTTFDPQKGELSTNIYQGVLQNTEWLGLTRNGKWFVYNKNIYDEPIIGIDSLKLLGEDIAIVFRGEDGLAIFPNKKVVEIVEGQYLKSIGPKIQTDVHFLVVKENGQNILYRDGEELFRMECDELGYISDNAFFVKQHDKYGAVGVDGKLIMRIRYDAISEAENGIAPVLFRGQFGAYNFRDKVLMRMDYQEKIKPYNSDLYIVNQEGQYGLLDVMNEIKVEPAFDQIQYWSDSSFLGLKDDLWQIVNISNNEITLSDVAYFEYMKDTPEEKILLVRKEEGYGVYHREKGLIVPAVFHDVMNLGNQETQLYFTETAVPEADIYVVVYYDTNGKKLFSEAYREERYEQLVCED